MFLAGFLFGAAVGLLTGCIVTVYAIYSGRWSE